MAELNISFNDDDETQEIAENVSDVLRFLSSVLNWKDDAGVSLEQKDRIGLSLILMSCESSLRRIR